MRYGELPKSLGIHEVDAKEMFFYQYLPIKLSGQHQIKLEERLNCFHELICKCIWDFGAEFGHKAYTSSYIYLTAKNLFVSPGHNLNREGWHSDGFLTDDINYIWSNNTPTLFNSTEFDLSNDHETSIWQMEAQANQWLNHLPENRELLRLNQFNIHRTGLVQKTQMRTFFKLSFSREKYNLQGNSHNYLLDYEWEMKPRKSERNHPIA